MAVSSDEDYGSDPGLQSPEPPDIRASMAKATQFSLDRTSRARARARVRAHMHAHAYAYVEVPSSPMTSYMPTAPLHRHQGYVGRRE